MSSKDFPADGRKPQTGVFEIETCIVQIGGEAVGLVTAEDHGLVFHAASVETWPIDRCCFSCRTSMEQAVRELLQMSGRMPRSTAKRYR